MFRRWWIFLLPHTYIPFFWPIFLIALGRQKHEAACLVRKAKNLLEGFGLEATDRERNVLAEGQHWARTGLASVA